ncbi:MAG: translation initiation factor IF-2 [Gammaproteobacteria bacterium]|nr:MAG: translation initiation factor IF-2 [Gammaproteobacteria bacterium]
MSEVTVKALAEQTNTDVSKLIEQLNEAGVKVADEKATITTEEKQKLLAYLRTRHGKPETMRKRIALKKKATLASKNGKETVVEVRGKKKVVNKGAKTNANSGRNSDKNKPKAAKPKRLSAAEIAKQLAEKKRMQQGDAMRQNEQEQRLRQEAEAKARLEAEAKAKKAKAEAEAQRQAEAKLRAEENKLKAEASAKQKTQAAEAKAKADAERKKNLEKDAKVNAETELKKQQEREKAAKKDREKDEQARKQAAADLRRQERVEQMGAAKYRNDRKDAKRNDRRGGQRRQNVRNNPNNRHAFKRPQKEVTIEVALPETLTVGELAQKANKKSAELIMQLMKMGSMMTINQVLDRDTASLLLEEMGIQYTYINENEAEEALLETVEAKLEDVRSRPPIVTIMGHVDHGKTSLLDYIRRTRVTAGEAGGITQHIGSYHVETDNGIVTFLDTPGHAAFTAMRARGAQVTDVVVIVIAADDSIMPQTIEAIHHAKAAKAPIVIAINKIDKPDADPEKVKSELTQYEIVPEDWGGNTMIANVSAKTGEGIDDLLEKILLESEVLELEAPHKGPAQGVIIESRVDKGRGVVASVLIQKGELNKGDFVLSGTEYGRIRAMNDETGHPIQAAGPSIPVEILGLSGAPMAGDELISIEDEKTAKELANQRQIKAKEARLARQQKAKLENLFAKVGDNQLEEVNVLLKTDVHGSAEALRESLLKLSTDEVAVRVVSATVGGITESDVNLAIASEATIIGFNVRAEAGAKKLAETEGVDLRYYSIIYEAIEDVKQAMIGKLAPTFLEEIVGVAEVRDVFKAPKIGQIAGCMVIDGYVKRSSPIRVLRDNVVIYEGELESLRRFKDDVTEVRAGTECGIGVKNYNDVKVGDQIECYERREVAREL